MFYYRLNRVQNMALRLADELSNLEKNHLHLEEANPHKEAIIVAVQTAQISADLVFLELDSAAEMMDDWKHICERDLEK